MEVAGPARRSHLQYAERGRLKPPKLLDAVRPRGVAPPLKKMAAESPSTTTPDVALV